MVLVHHFLGVFKLPYDHVLFVDKLRFLTDRLPILNFVVYIQNPLFPDRLNDILFARMVEVTIDVERRGRLGFVICADGLVLCI